MNITERLQAIVDNVFDGNKAAFARAIGIAPTSVSNYLSRDRASKPSSDILESIVKGIPLLNGDWLLTGKGEMLRKPNGLENNISDSVVGSITGNIGTHSTVSNSMSQKKFSPNSSTEEKQSEEEATIEQLKHEIQVKEEKIREMERTITSQEKTIIAQEKMISLLEKN